MLKEGVLNKVSPEKFHLLVGEIVSLFMGSKVHRNYEIRDVADIILPFINANQFRIYHDEKKRPIALLTWAKFSQEVEAEYLNGKIVLSEAEINSGEIIYFTDFIAPYGHTKLVVRDIKNNLFVNETAKAVRFISKGKRRSRVWVFKGRDYSK